MSGGTIFARSTGALPSAIAIVRVSGPDAGAALRTLTGRDLPAPRMALVRALRHPATTAAIDRAMVVWLPGPATVTGDDIVEFHVHGGRAVVAALEAALGTLPGLTPAAPGAFTQRAFENGRLDLSQVEGLADLLAAETERQRSAALAMSEGGLRRGVAEWQDALISLAARAEALLDFADEGDVASDPLLLRDIDELRSRFAKAASSPPAERLRHGVRVVLAGPPNAGKSTLLNALAGREAAIASPIAGTTRDVIEVPIILDGIPIVLTDTAGMHEGAVDEIERIGVECARRAIAQADLTLWLGDPAEVHDGEVVIVEAKCDVRDGPNEAAVAVSAVTGEGMHSLRQRIAEHAARLLPAIGSVALSTAQQNAVQRAAAALGRAALQEDLVLCAEELRAAMHALNCITGSVDTEAMLDALFSRFCVGK